MSHSNEAERKNEKQPKTNLNKKEEEKIEKIIKNFKIKIKKIDYYIYKEGKNNKYHEDLLKYIENKICNRISKENQIQLL